MYCPNCGNYIAEDDYCHICNKNYKPQTSKDGSNFGWGVLGFFFPIVGFILFCVWNKDKHSAAKASGIGALIRVAIYFLMIVILMVFLILSPIHVDYDCSSCINGGYYDTYQNKCVCSDNAKTY